MKYRIITTLTALVCFAMGFAGSIQFCDVTLRPGEIRNLQVLLFSAVSDKVGVQFDVTLPNGFSLKTIDDTSYQMSSNQINDLACNASNLGNGTYRFIIYSNNMQKLKAGELMTLNLKAGNEVALGNYTVLLNNVAFSDVDGHVVKEDGTTNIIRLTNFYPASKNIEMPDIKLLSGETTPLKLNLLESISGCVGIQFDLSLPDGITLVKEDTDKEYAISVNQTNDVTCNMTMVGSGKYRFILYSNSLMEFVPGELMEINLKVSEEKPLDNYYVSIENVQLSDICGNMHKDNGNNANIKVTKYFTLLYKVDGHDYKSYKIEYGEAITAEAAPTMEGYTFSGWSEIPETMPANDVTVTGTFNINKYKLIYQVDGEDYKTYEVEYGSLITQEPVPTKEGYVFSGWSEIPETMPAKDVIITGTFSLIATEDIITITSAGQTTWCSNKNLDFTAYPELKAYVATGYDKSSGTIWLTRVKNVPANTGFLLMGKADTYEIPVKADGSSSYYMNLFKGTIENTTIQTTEGNYTNYYLSKGDAGIGFYKVTKDEGVALAANRAYLSVPTEIPAIGSEGSSETIKVSSAGQVPYYNSQSLDFSSLDAQGVKAYTATGYDYTSGTIWLTRVKQVPAKTGILIMAPQGEYPVPTASVASVYANMFKGTLTGTTIQTHETIADEDYINYYLSRGDAGVGFYKVTKEGGVTIGANRCYLPIKNKEVAAGTRSAGSGQNQITFEEADEVIGIQLLRGIGDDNDGTTNLTPALSEGEGAWYTLQGQRVAKPGKGLYIRNGKKVVIR